MVTFRLQNQNFEKGKRKTCLNKPTTPEILYILKWYSQNLGETNKKKVEINYLLLSSLTYCLSYSCDYIKLGPVVAVSKWKCKKTCSIKSDYIMCIKTRVVLPRRMRSSLKNYKIHKNHVFINIFKLSLIRKAHPSMPV